MNHYPKMANFTCHRCNKRNPFSYFKPVLFADNKSEGTCLCSQCAKERGFINFRTGLLKEGVQL